MALTNSQYDAIMRIYEQKHLRTHDRLTRHYSEYMKRFPGSVRLMRRSHTLVLQEPKR